MLVGPLHENKFTHNETLKCFSKMKIDIENGGGVYQFKNICDKSGK